VAKKVWKENNFGDKCLVAPSSGHQYARVSHGMLGWMATIDRTTAPGFPSQAAAMKWAEAQIKKAEKKKQ
jgi:hypothetical protein